MHTRNALPRPHRTFFGAAALLLLAGCGPNTVAVPEPRTLVNRNGARLTTAQPQMQESYQWFTAQITEIQENPSFLIITRPTTADIYPWESIELTERGDSALVQYRQTVPDLQPIYQIYAHLHILAERNEVESWLPSATGLEGWEREMAFVDRMAEAWLLGRASFDFTPYPPIDQLIYAREAGMLEPLLLSLRGEEFPEDRDRWLEANPGGEAAFRRWYRETFGGDPKPIRAG